MFFWRRGRTAASLNLQIGVDAQIGGSMITLHVGLTWIFTDSVDVMIDGLKSPPQVEEGGEVAIIDGLDGRDTNAIGIIEVEGIMAGLKQPSHV